MVKRARTRSALIGVALTLLTAACGQPVHEPLSSSAEGEPEQVERDVKHQRFDPLAISVVLESERVPSGQVLRSRLVVLNRSGQTVVDPVCHIAEGRYALVPVEEPGAELWVRPLTDCGGPHRMEPGFRDDWLGPDFPAHTKYGDPLPAGDYLAVLDIRGHSQRLEYPVTVE